MTIRIQCLLFQTVLLFAIGCGSGLENKPDVTEPTGTVASEVADFVLKDIDGRSHALFDYVGRRVVVISFWATWCPPCLKEMGQLQTIYERHAEQGLQVLSICIDEPETVGDARTYVKQRGFTYPVLLDTEQQVISLLYPERIPPYTVVIDRAGKIVWTHAGFVVGDEVELEAVIVEASGQSPVNS